MQQAKPEPSDTVTTWLTKEHTRSCLMSNRNLEVAVNWKARLLRLPLTGKRHKICSHVAMLKEQAFCPLTSKGRVFRVADPESSARASAKVSWSARIFVSRGRNVNGHKLFPPRNRPARTGCYGVIVAGRTKDGFPSCKA